MASPREIRDAIIDDLTNDDPTFDAAVYADGILFTARHHEISLIVRDEQRLEDIAEIEAMIDDLDDRYYKTTEAIVNMLLGL